MGVKFFELVVGQDSPTVRKDDAVCDQFPPTHLRPGTMIFILGRVEDALICDKCTHTHSRYFIQGLFSEQQLADDNALDESYFVGPLPLNMALPHDPIEWHGLYWPLLNRDVKDANSGSLLVTPDALAGGDSDSS